MNMFEDFCPLPGSERAPFEGAHAGKPHIEQEIDVTLYLRRPEQLNPLELTVAGRFLRHSMMGVLFSAGRTDMELTIQFASHFRLSIVDVNRQKRYMTVRGTIDQMERAFRVRLFHRYKAGRVHRTRSGPIMLPKCLVGIVTAVLGLDNRPQAVSRLRLSRAHIGLPLKPDAFDGNQLASIYDFPPGTGAGQTVALIELAGGYRMPEIQAFFAALSLPCPVVKSVGVAGGLNLPGIDTGADVEVALDIEVTGAAAPSSEIVVYFAPNTDHGFVQAILAAIHDEEHKPSIISISWGAPESTWTQQSLDLMNEAFQSAAALGISVFVAAGDSGAGDDMNDGECHVDFPASSPCVTACGGTKLVMDKNIRQEVVWNESENGEGATGGGISDVFPRPSYQQNVGSIPPNLSGGMSGRALPDVAAVADPETGYAVFVNGGWNIIGGTSAVAPLFAGLLARINQQLGRNAGLINPTLYAAGVSCGFNDIQTGDNSYNGVRGYVATAGWDPVTGWGSPGGNALLKLLSASAGPSWAGQ